MALTISDVSYSGTYASYFWLPATYGLDSVSKGVLHVQDGIKKQHTIGRVDFNRPLQPRSAVPVSKGTFTVDGRTLVPQDLMLYTEFNPRDYEAHFLAEQLSQTLLARELPVTAENFMMQMALNRAFEQIETMIWQGSTAYANNGSYDETTSQYQLQFFDGFIKKMVADGAILRPGTQDALTSTNIGDRMKALLNLIATNKKALLSSSARYERMKFLMSVNSATIYEDFLTTQTYKNNDTTERGINRYRGYEVVPCAGMPDDTIVFCEATPDVNSNLYLGMNSMEDNNLQLMKLQNNAELFFIKGLMKYDTQYGFSEQIALHTTLTTASFQ